jgi:two-component system, OmpR family, phosphate regulon sensor histidine kinase PhoR
MKIKFSASTIMRIISILGILFLLSLQYIWLRNAYMAVEKDLVNKCSVSLKEAVEIELYSRDQTGHIRFGNRESKNRSDLDKSKESQKISSSSDINILLHEDFLKWGYPADLNEIDSIFRKKIIEDFGYIPDFTLKIITEKTLFIPNNNIPIIKTAITSSKILILYRLGRTQSLRLELTSPATIVFQKARIILIVSVVLVLFIGIILIIQFIGMFRERKFTNFIKEYTRMITHELRSPVTGIYMLINKNLKDKTTDLETLNKTNTEALNQCNKLLLNLDNILYVARSEQRKLPINKSEVELQRFLLPIVSNYRNRDYSPKVVNISATIVPEQMKVSMDIGLMENVLCNLLENAIKYSGLTVTIKIDCRLEKNGLTISVKDDGFGISANDQKHVFGLYVQGTSKQSQGYPGYGIGLHFVQRVVKAHGGKVSLISSGGKGSEFILQLPTQTKS